MSSGRKQKPLLTLPLVIDFAPRQNWPTTANRRFFAMLPEVVTMCYISERFAVNSILLERRANFRLQTSMQFLFTERAVGFLQRIYILSSKQRLN